MRFKIHSGEMKRMMKTVLKCVETRAQSRNSNIQVRHSGNMMTIRGTNGTFSAEVSTPMLGGDGESFCVDGAMFGKVTAILNGEIEISEDGKACIIKGAGRTRIPVIEADIPEFSQVSGKTVVIDAETFRRCWENVRYAVAKDDTRLVLTGVLVESDGSELRMVALDGFRMAVDRIRYDGDSVRAVIPGAFMELVAGGTADGEKVTLTFGDNRIQAETEGMRLQCGMLTGEYPQWKKILPNEFKTECRVNTAEMKEALRNGSVVTAKNNLVKMRIGENEITLESNSEEADYSAQVGCEMKGSGMVIAFNQSYITDMMNHISGDECVMSFNSPMTPCVAKGMDGESLNLLLPVRVAE